MQNEENTMAQIDEQEVEGMQTEPTATSEDIFSEIFGTTAT